MHEPKWRTMVGMIGIVAWIVVWVVLVVEVADGIGGWPFILQMIFYVVAGLGWILPLKPLLKWMETGHLR